MYQLITASTDLTTKPKRLTAWHFAETAAAAAVVILRDGGSGGPIVARINLAASTSASQAYPGPQFLTFPAGLYVEKNSGTIVGSVDLV